MKFDAYQMVTDRICALLEKGLIPWEIPWASVASCAWSGVDGHAYSLLNQFCLADPEKNYDDMSDLFADVAGEWVTFKGALDRGGNVRKGEHGRKVIFFSMVPKKGEENGEEITEYIPYINWTTVFKISQCDGINQKFHLDAGKLYDFSENQSAEDVAASYLKREGIELIKIHGNRAYYSPSEDKIRIPIPEQYKNGAEYYSTLFHEMVHSTGHEKRLNRIKSIAKFGDEEYSTEELVAEIGSASMLATLGVENELSFRNSAGYIQGWLKALKSDKKMLVTASARAEKAIRMILNV